MIRVLFFARLREVLGCESLELPCDFYDLGGLRQALMARGPDWQEFLAPGTSLGAVNQTLAKDDVPLQDGDEVAFFPPVTGG
ncbi:molybdopterin synthase sulfur carrier subunit [Aliiglaciecola sp. CAU 1673]|uniref:molybdopterin synthase sulfur carrier subunit n=1 Tax=Aliiglaciecola sp. CAU 1673 TaxID=3032595 RepID=UPI0023D9BA42|nr:molybdopterin synthase sulfur carrier subunit [Aliiglaciecola sp. CAU 1673]MDF2177395.1 molybdopterin synthase sulfur carrier subunit [Aliiglaciecola sp. CAU 1673]